MKPAEIYVNKAKKDPAKKIENIDKAIGVYAVIREVSYIEDICKASGGKHSFPE